MSDAPSPTPAWSLPALLLAVTAVYAAVLPAGLLNYDDAWLITTSPFLRAPTLAELGRAWTLFDLDTRLVLGAEYLPVRDTAAWLLARVFGVSGPVFHLAQLGLYLGAVTALRGCLRRVCRDPAVAEVTAWLFALHPAHVESVAWAAGLKDALSLLFLTLAMRAHAEERRWRAAVVASLTALACLSKGASVVAPLLLLAVDLLARRRIAWASHQ
jgi:hypothetical protein